MKYLKSFELYNSTGQIIDYEVGDIVICDDDELKKPNRLWTPSMVSSGTRQHNPLKNGVKYKVIKIYSIPEDKFLGNKFLRVDVENLETGEISKGWESTRFKTELESAADKYNM